MVAVENKKEMSRNIFIVLSAIFIGSLVTCNLIMNKWVAVDLGFKTFNLSAGVLPYPITFLITDILSEIYGRRETSKVVFAGFITSLFVLVFLKLGAYFPAIEISPLANSDYNQVFANTKWVIGSSMVAYLASQFLDVKLFHFWKTLTKGKHLWLRNNASTIASQLTDTILVTTILLIGVKSSPDIFSLIIDGWLFKILCAAFDTPLFYLSTGYLRGLFDLELGEEIQT